MKTRKVAVERGLADTLGESAEGVVVVSHIAHTVDIFVHFLFGLSLTRYTNNRKL